MLAPEEIQAREFLVSLRGYDRDEVHAFLEEVANYISELQAQIENLQTGAPASDPPTVEFAPPPEARLSDPSEFFADLGKTTQRILEAAHEAGSEIQRKACEEADRELAAACDHAGRLVAEGQRRREVIEGIVHLLEERRSVLADHLRGFANTVEQVLEDLAPPGSLLTQDKLSAAAAITAPGEDWGLDETEVLALDEPDDGAEDDDAVAPAVAAGGQRPAGGPAAARPKRPRTGS